MRFPEEKNINQLIAVRSAHTFSKNWRELRNMSSTMADEGESDDCTNTREPIRENCRLPEFNDFLESAYEEL